MKPIRTDTTCARGIVTCGPRAPQNGGHVSLRFAATGLVVNKRFEKPVYLELFNRILP